MKQVSHIFLKDVRRFWPEIVTSIALLAAFGWNAMRSWGLPEELVAVSGGWFEYKFLPGVVYVALPVVWAFLILRVVQAESLVGDRQFWITRPYEWSALLVEKLMFVLAFINLPMLVLQVVLLRRAGFHPSHYILALLWMQLMLCLNLIAAVTLAAITPTIIQALLVLLPIVLYGIGMAVLSNYIPSSSFSGPVDNISELLFIATCILVIVLQYARRRTSTARWLIVALGGVLLIILVATPYRAIVAHEYPPIASGKKAPFEFTLLPGKSSAAIPVTEKDVQIRIPVSISGLGPDSIVNANAVLFELNAPGTASWNSGWSSPARVFYPEQRRTTLDFTLKKHLFDRMRDASITLHVSLAYTLYRDQNQREFVIPNGKFELAGVGLCSGGWGYLAGLNCMAPMRRPESFLISTDLSANTCPLGNNEARPAPGVMARAWERNGSDPAEFDVDPVQTFRIYASPSNSGGDQYRYANGLCPGTPVILSNPGPMLQSQSRLSADHVRLMDYREPPPQFAVAEFRSR